MVNPSRFSIVASVIAWLLAPSLAAALDFSNPAPLPETNSNPIEYPSVRAALEALHAKPGVLFSQRNGWTVAEDEAHLTFWSFALPDNPAYPAVVRREAVKLSTGQYTVVTRIHCENTKRACDEFVRLWQQYAAQASAARTGK